MTDLTVISAIAEYLKENTRDILLEKPPEQGQSKSTERVPPAVYEGYVPPKNYLYEFGYDVPLILVGIDGGNDTGADASVDIRITCGTYSSGAINKDGQYQFDAEGYADLLYLMNRIKTLLFTANVIKGQTTVRKPLKWGLYEEQAYPFWHGWIAFSASTAVIEADPDTIIRAAKIMRANRYDSEMDIILNGENE